jgi:DNA-directed RNA polymerase specialized sigma24 family protein
VADAAFERSYSTCRRVAAVHAATIVVLYGLPNEDRRDLEQEGLLELWRKLPLFDVRRASWRTFAERVVANRMTSVVRGLHSTRCGYGKEEPLDEVGPTLRAPDECIELRADIRRVLASVSQFDQAVALSLIDHSAVETSWRLGVSRATVYRAIGRLRAAFTAAGLACRPWR